MEGVVDLTRAFDRSVGWDEGCEGVNEFVAGVICQVVNRVLHHQLHHGQELLELPRLVVFANLLLQVEPPSSHILEACSDDIH